MANHEGKKSLTVNELERAKQLRGLGWSYFRIGKELKRSDKTVKKVLTQTPEVIKEIKDIAAKIAGEYEGLSQRILQSIDGKVIKDAGLRDRVISAGVCTDKARLLHGESTENIGIAAVISLVDKQIIEELKG